MAYEFRLPDIGEGLTEAEVVRWLVDVGDEVAADQPIVEVETDKAIVDIPAPRAGVLLHQGAKPGETIAVGEILAVIGDPGETWSPDGPTGASSAEAPPIVGTLSEEAEELGGSAPAAPTGGERRVRALPVVRKLARELGVDLASIEGSGPGGRITREDVLAAAQATSAAASPQEQAAAPATAAPSRTASSGVATDGSDERVPLSKLRRTIAEHMSRSWREIPHVTTFDEVDATRLLAARRALKDRWEAPVPMEAMVIAAVVPALKAFPEFNATLDGDTLVVHRRYDIGVAVDTPDGLVVAVVPGADRLPLRDLAAEVAATTEQARARRLGPDRLSGQTFTVSNIGAVGGGLGTPIVPYGTTAILSVGRAEDKVVVRDGEIDIAPVIGLSLSYDHRVIDGALGRRFMAMVMANLEEPALFLAG